jgi:hypothetical protein
MRELRKKLRDFARNRKSDDSSSPKISPKNAYERFTQKMPLLEGVSRAREQARRGEGVADEKAREFVKSWALQ